MCGYVGFVDLERDKSSGYLTTTICRMRDRLVHRGPDDAGCWVDQDSGIALGHRRLSIIDTAKTGHQPMHSACSRYVVVYNGEIYNYRNVRKLLEKSDPEIAWRGHSDTEVLLEAFAHWGAAAALDAFVGMFSCCLFDREARKIYLCRDRMGEKPLYYGWLDNVFIFASELKAFKAHPRWHGEINPESVADYLRCGYVPTPLSIYKNIYKLEPGHYLCVDLKKLKYRQSFDQYKSCYWAIDYQQACDNSKTYSFDENQSIDELSTLLKETVANQMIADVPLGAFLSGGIDSSTVVALMQSQSSKKIKTFTIGFEEKAYDESAQASAVATHLGTDHTEFRLSQQDALAVIPSLPEIYDEPFSDVSQIPTLLLSMVTRKHVTVSLSGDGGDELFAGYSRYRLADDVWKIFHGIPLTLRNSLSRTLKKLPDQTIERLCKGMSGKIMRYGREGHISHKIKNFADLVKFTDRVDLYDKLIHRRLDTDILSNDIYAASRYELPRKIECLDNYIDYMACYDQNHYLPDDILVKLDRAAMSVSLESRVPLLDHRIVEFAWRIPQCLKVRKGQGKWILRQVLKQHLPAQLLEHPKKGLGVPLRAWLRNDLREWSEALLSEHKLDADGIFSAAAVRQKWQDHLSGRANLEGMLWNILMFQAWLDNERKQFWLAA